MNLDIFLKSKGFHISEGYSQQVPKQVHDLINLTSQPNIKIMEIGFNAGHSADLFLKNNPNSDTSLYSIISKFKFKMYS